MKISRFGLRFAALAAALFVASFATPVLAGQVRVSVGTPVFGYSPGVVNVNTGDRVCWVWTAGSHTVTSGDSSTATPNGTFSAGSGPFGVSASSFSWRAQTGVFPYFCIPHAPTMAGRVIASPGNGIPVPDFHLTEVQFNADGGLDLVEITNMGPVAGNLGKFRLAANTSTAPLSLSVTLSGTELPVPSGGRVVVHLNTTGTNSATDLFYSGFELPASGSVALYVPNQIQPSLALADQIIDFVQWGAASQPNEATAVAAGLWTAGAFIGDVAAGHSIEFCGQASEHGFAFWSEVAVPNLGTDGDCATPTERHTWGSLKTRYR